MALISIKTIADRAKAKGFRVNMLRGTDGTTGAEIFAPEHNGPDAVWYGGSQYSCSDFVVYDRPCGGYGYNSFFYGPWHDGMTQSTAHGVSKLLAHPAMQD